MLTFKYISFGHLSMIWLHIVTLLHRYIMYLLTAVYVSHNCNEVLTAMLLKVGMCVKGEIISPSHFSFESTNQLTWSCWPDWVGGTVTWLEKPWVYSPQHYWEGWKKNQQNNTMRAIFSFVKSTSIFKFKTKSQISMILNLVKHMNSSFPKFCVWRIVTECNEISWQPFDLRRRAGPQLDVRAKPT